MEKNCSKILDVKNKGIVRVTLEDETIRGQQAGEGALYVGQRSTILSSIYIDNTSINRENCDPKPRFTDHACR